jgi:dihydroxyacetone kinase DhaKLM complex PTS-EIIA-like component DhaM
VLGLGPVDEDELYHALDGLGAAQPAIERALARRHLKDGTLVLYDVTSSYLEGRMAGAEAALEIQVLAFMIPAEAGEGIFIEGA